MPLPEDGLRAIQRWVEALNADMPEHVRKQLRYETGVYRNAVTLMECRLAELDQPDGNWFRVPLARLRFLRSRGWELYWADRNDNFHLYELVEPTSNVTRLLDEISDDLTGIFFG